MKIFTGIPKWPLYLFALLLLSSSVYAQNRTVTGVVTDENRDPLPFVTVAAVGATTGTVTDMNGRFSITVPTTTQELRASFVGFKTQTITLGAATSYTVVLESTATQLEQVVIVGSMERAAESFTGSFNTVGGGELRRLGSQNLVESLKSLDASFVVLENIAMGANPNVMPTIEIRGQTSINFTEIGDIYRADPNQPLFILDGFETTLQKIVDLDFNRVQSVTILKDAASTAFYGSRAANGVVVVETIRGEPGRFRLSYAGDYSIQIPNVKSYNMMNAAEKLEFERLSGRYIYNEGRINNAYDALRQANLDMQYSERLAEVARGVNSHWISEPLQIPFLNRQSVRMSGGREDIMIEAGFSYRNAPGAMIGSKRENWTGDFDFFYTLGKLTLINRLGLSGFTGTTTPYGKFDTWVNTNPYYRKVDSNGIITRYLDVVTGFNTSVAQTPYTVPNPLFNAGLNSLNEERNLDVNQRLLAQWAVYKGMSLETMIQVQTGSLNRVVFTPPAHTMFDGYPVDQKGRYQNMTIKNTEWMGNLMYVWRNRIGVHNYIINIRGEVSHKNKSDVVWEATDFPVGSPANPAFANSYVYGRPRFENPITRRANFLGSVNYAYDSRYLFDATYRLDGSTVFGAEDMFKPFWSTGIGWNIHNEKFMKQFRFVSNLRLRATTGQTGNQNIDGTIGSTIFSYLSGGNLFGTGLAPTTLGNPYIQWQKTNTNNLSLDLSLFDSRLVSKFEVYEKKTDPMVVSVDRAPSTGIKSMPMSLGALTYTGFEFDVVYHIIRSRDIHWRASVMGATLKGVYSGFSNQLEEMNETLRESNILGRYRDGYAPTTIWAVQSLGIDPASGREVFLDKNGQPTFYHSSNYEIAAGDKQPKLLGTFQTSFTYKQFTLNVVMRYSLGADVFNQALFNKVENISYAQIAFNQDRRALYDRWQNPGDIAEFKSIRTTTSTPMSSRFVQRENAISGESIGLMWRLTPAENPWLKNMRMTRLDFNFTAIGTGGVFRISNVRRERGTEFPEATTLSLSVSAGF
jgi:TonB-linked SusC/RagA family outer membrane protein